MTVMMYGAPPQDNLCPECGQGSLLCRCWLQGTLDPRPFVAPSSRRPDWERVTKMLPGERRADIVKGLAKLLERLRPELKGKSLDEDEVLAMVWLEGLRAGGDQ